ncbi:hypothetical protein C414_000420001 [Campylobacter jejuni subsp. jejuni 414]|nr:hypothetical protein C414_000420001 [Campylobacter jejuni subsp. jejuni 414]
MLYFSYPILRYSKYSYLFFYCIFVCLDWLKIFQYLLVFDFLSFDLLFNIYFG